MPLSGKAVAELQNALISAFSADELTRLVRIHLDENLGAIAGDDNLSQTVFELITWADRQGRLDELIRGATNVNPGNRELRTWIETHSAQIDAGDVSPPAPKTKLPLDLCSSPPSIDSTTESKTDWCTMPPQKQDAPLFDLSTGSLIDLPTVKLPISVFKNVTDPPKLSSIANTKPQQTDNRKLKVFLCHASEDKEMVRKLYHQLKADGVDPWLDEEKLLPGQIWRREIPKAVRSSDVVLVCLSHNSLDKDGYFQTEIQFALDEAEKLARDQIFLIPVRLEDCRVPSTLSNWQWVNLFDSEGYFKLFDALRKRATTLGASDITTQLKEPFVANTKIYVNESKTRRAKQIEYNNTTEVATITGRQLQQLQQALLSGYDMTSLTQMLRFEMDVKLSEIAGGDNFSDKVFNLIDWTEGRGRLHELVSSAYMTNPENLKIRKVALAILGKLPSVLSDQQSPGSLWVDAQSGAVTIGGKPLSLLTRTEFKLMLLLFQNSEMIVDKNQIVRAIWEDIYTSDGYDPRIEKLVSRLRRKIEPDPNNPRYLTTVRGRGYRLVTDISL